MRKQKNSTWLEAWLRAKHERSLPLLYLLICILAFGLFIPFLGFYWDDWPTIFYTHSNRIAQLITHFSYDRPFSVWAYYLIGRLGTAPLVWQLAALLLRWAVVVAMAWALQPLWPKHIKKILYIALIFAVYPGYYVQPLSVIFTAHLAAYIFFFVSLGAMGRAISEPRQFRKFTLLALAAALVHAFTLEYYVGLELIRPLYIWIVLTRLEPKNKRPVARALRLWVPYLIILIAWFIWRLFLVKLPSEPYPLGLSSNPFAAFAQLLQVAIKDWVYVFLITWSETVQPILIRLAVSIDWLAWSTATGSALVLYFLLRVYQKILTPPKESEDEDRRFANQGMLLGLFAFFAGMVPVWVIGETIAQGDYNQRYILIAMFGAAVFLVALITYLIPLERNRLVLITLLVSLAISSHLRNTNEFRLDWETQRNFYWQLFWRAPTIQSGTALISFDRLTYWTGEPLLGDALNTLYSPHAAPPAVDLWDFELTRTQTVERIRNGELLTNNYRGLTFSMSEPKALFFYYKPIGACLWVLNPVDADNSYLPFDNRGLVSFSNTANILPEGGQGPDTTVFQAEPVHDWCYYFEKADLARQQRNWETVFTLMAEAQQKGLGPNIGIEWLPLLEAYGMTGDWPKAQALSLTIHRMHSKNDSMICATWHQMLQAGSSPQAMAAFAQVSDFAGCSK